MIWGDISWPLKTDVPRSPRRAPLSQSTYWTAIGSIQAEFRAKGIDCLRRCLGAEHHLGRVAREHVHHREHEDGRDKHAEREHSNSSNDVHAAPLCRSGNARRVVGNDNHFDSTTR